MKRIWSCFLLIAIISVLAVCYNVQQQSVEVNTYNGRALSIGIIGEPPKILEEQVTFVKIEFSDLEKDVFDSQYDAIFITKDNLSEAAQEKYVSIYKESKIPLFFLQSEKSYVPFIEESLSYEEVDKLSDQTYATGMIYHNNDLKFWEYGLYNDTENQSNIEDVYSRIFETISQNTTEK